MTIPIEREDGAMREAGVRSIETLTWREGPPGLLTLTLAPLANGSPVGSFMSIARFRLTRRVFPPHPHAGFSAITYVLEHSETPMHNRDSLGDRSLIEAGGSHWTIANDGMMHEETPEDDGKIVDGFQIFLNHPPPLKHAAPGSAHFGANDFPIAELALGASAKVIIGSYGGVTSPAPLPSPALLVQLDLERDARHALFTHDGWDAGLLVERGTIAVELSSGTVTLGPAGYLVFDGSSPVSIVAREDSQLFLFAGPPVADPVAIGGPFIMNTEEEIADAFAHFRSGKMGALAPRPLAAGAD